MYRWMIVAAAAVGMVGCSESGGPADKDAGVNAEAAPAADKATDAAHAAAGDKEGVMREASVLGYTMNRIDGTPEPLSDYAGKVVMIVNVASRCGNTPQYEGLEAMYEKYKDRGLVVLGFPANDFKGQEPGTNAEILEFCTAEYGVSFPMFEKITVIGDAAHPLYKQLSAASAEPSWNFTKYLIGRDGRLVGRIDPQTEPDDPAVVAEVEKLLEG